MLESFDKFKDCQVENFEFILGGGLTETGDAKLNAEMGSPQDLYDDVNKRYIFFQ